MSATDGWTGCASIAVSDLAALAEYRRSAEIRVICNGPHAWVAWEETAAGIIERLRSLPGSEVYERRDGLWFRTGCRLPAFGLPRDWAESISLSRAIVPGQFRPIEVGSSPPVQPLHLQLVTEQFPHATSALRCSLEALAAWAERATTGPLGDVQAACAEDDVFLTGHALPSLAGAVRYWGRDVFVPLGLRAEPSLSEPALRAVLRVEAGAFLILDRDGFDTVPRTALRPLTRAGIRLARARKGGGA